MDISAIGRQFGLNDAQTRAALEALAPVIAAGMRRSAGTPDGLQDIFRSVLAGNRARTLDDENAIQFDNAKSSGDEILAQIFGDKDVSRGVANQLSATSGIGAAILKKLLPIVASIVMGQVAKKMGAGSGAGGGGFGDILKDILGGGLGGGGGGGAPRGGMGIPDVDLGGQKPHVPNMPLPEAPADSGRPRSSTGNPLEDMLNDILNGGGKGGVVVKQIPPEQMGEILKDIFGGNFPGGATGQELPPRRQPSLEAVTRGRKTLDDVLGGGTRQGDAADILLDSVTKSIRRR
jgi:hypothetical protein